MATRDLILSVDFGTSTLKASVLDRQLRTLASGKEEYPYILLPGEKVEMSPASLADALRTACGRMDAALRARVGLFCYDSFSPSLMLMDADGKALHNVVTHMDRRSREQSNLICEVMGKERYQSITGVYPFTGGISLTTLLWFMKEMPELVERTEKIGHLPTYFQKMFTGEWAVDLVNASMMGLYDTVRQSGWSEEIIRRFTIPERWLSPIRIPGEWTGNLVPEMAEMMGVPAGIPVAMGTNDVVAAHAGAGNDRAGQILNTAGSSDMVSILTDAPKLNPNYYVRNAGVPGLWQIYATTSGGFAVDWFYKEFCREMDKKEFYETYLPSCLRGRKPGAIAFDPYLAEDRQSLERRTGAWHGLTLVATRDEMLFALMHSMQKVLADTVALAGRITPLDGVMKISGGFASEAVLELKRAMFAGLEFEMRDDCSILGNAALALKYEPK